MGSLTSPNSARHQVSGYVTCGFAYTSPYTLTPGYPSPGLSYPPASPLRLAYYQSGSRSPPALPEGSASIDGLASPDSALALLSGYGNINPLSIDYACPPRPRSRLTRCGFACRRYPST